MKKVDLKSIGVIVITLKIEIVLPGQRYVLAQRVFQAPRGANFNTMDRESRQ
jgi:hypothetical protein